MNILDCRDGERIPFGETLSAPGTVRRLRVKATGTPKRAFDPFSHNGVLGDLCEVLDPGGEVNAALTEEFFRRFRADYPNERSLRSAGVWLAEQP